MGPESVRDSSHGVVQADKSVANEHPAVVKNISCNF
jgi:hypothetical protein